MVRFPTPQVKTCFISALSSQPFLHVQSVFGNTKGVSDIPSRNDYLVLIKKVPLKIFV